MERYANYVGIIGVVLILISYGFVNIDILKPSDKIYLFLNLFGSIFILVSLYYFWNLPSFIIEVAWIFLTLVGFVRRKIKKTNP